MCKYMAGFLHGVILTVLWAIVPYASEVPWSIGIVPHKLAMLVAIVASVITFAACVINLGNNWDKI